jgi:DNA polymerase-3 subunit alpha
MNLNDEKTWNLFKEGHTKGIFQLENAGSWSKRVIPQTIEELSDLVSIIRPGCTRAILDGKSLTNHYIDRKHKKDEVKYIHESLVEILESTQGVLVYQEQAMKIAVKLAGFNLEEADDLRKAIGKKKADLMAKIRVKFIEGCKTTGIVDENIAKEVFDWIEKSSRYSFNKSHGISYAINAYESAWYKANYPKEFFLSYLYYAQEKQDPHQEIYELVSDAKFFNIEIKLPTIANFNKKFNIQGEDIYFGVKDVKSLTGTTGDKVFTCIREVEEEIDKESGNFSWMDILVHLSPKINKTSFEALASIGFFSTKKTGVTRNKVLHEYSIFRILTKAELAWVTKNYSLKRWNSLFECFTDLSPIKKEGGGTHNFNRSQVIGSEIQLLTNPPYNLSDDPNWIIQQETRILGCPISLSKIESSDTSSSNTTCKDISNGKSGKGICVAANIIKMNDYKIKKSGNNKGKLMSFLTIEDESCSVDNVIVFPEAREKYKFLLYEGNNLLLCGEVGKDKSFIIDKIHEI